MWAEVSKQMTEVWVWTAFLLFQTMKGVSVASSQAEYGITLRVKEAVKFRFSLVFSQKEKKKRNIRIMDKEKRKALQNLFLLFSLFLLSNIRLRCKDESSLSWDSEICSWSSARPFKSPKRVKKKKKPKKTLRFKNSTPFPHFHGGNTDKARANFQGLPALAHSLGRC